MLLSFFVAIFRFSWSNGCFNLHGLNTFDLFGQGFNLVELLLHALAAPAPEVALHPMRLQELAGAIHFKALLRALMSLHLWHYC